MPPAQGTNQHRLDHPLQATSWKPPHAAPHFCSSLQVKKALQNAEVHDLPEDKDDDTIEESRIENNHRDIPVLVTQLRVPIAAKKYLSAKITAGDVYGPEAAIEAAVQMQYHKPLRALFLLLKALLKQHCLNDPDNGGLSSYCLFLMVCCNNACIRPACSSCNDAPSCCLFHMVCCNMLPCHPGAGMHARAHANITACMCKTAASCSMWLVYLGYSQACVAPSRDGVCRAAPSHASVPPLQASM